MDWWLPAISAGAGLAGVLIGSSLTTRREREERRLRFTQQQLEEFYAPSAHCVRRFGRRARFACESAKPLPRNGQPCSKGSSRQN